MQGLQIESVAKLQHWAKGNWVRRLKLFINNESESRSSRGHFFRAKVATCRNSFVLLRYNSVKRRWTASPPKAVGDDMSSDYVSAIKMVKKLPRFSIFSTAAIMHWKQISMTNKITNRKNDIRYDILFPPFHDSTISQNTSSEQQKHAFRIEFLSRSASI